MHDTEMVRSVNLGSKLQTTTSELVADFLLFVYFKICLREVRGRGRGGFGPRIIS